MIFPDLLCIDTNSLVRVIRLNMSDLYKFLDRASYTMMERLPAYCVQSLLELGFIDREEFMLFIVPDSDCFVSFLRTLRVVVQPLPVEMVDVMLFARRQMLESLQARVRDYVDAAKQRFLNSEGMGMLLDATESE